MNLLQLELQLRYNRFTWGNAEDNLHGARGLNAMPSELMKALINEAANELNMQLRFDVQIQHDSFTEDSDVMAMPTNMLAVQKIIVFDDENSAGSSTAISTHKASDGHPLEGPCLSYEYLINGRDSLTGQPTRFMLWEQDGTLYAQLDRECDAAYFFDIYYYPTQPTLSSDSDTPAVNSSYHSLIRSLAAQKIAEFLGDQRRKAEFATTFQADLLKMKGSRRYGAPAGVMFRLNL